MDIVVSCLEVIYKPTLLMDFVVNCLEVIYKYTLLRRHSRLGDNITRVRWFCFINLW